jgi:hypothetical protein
MIKKNLIHVKFLGQDCDDDVGNMYLLNYNLAFLL